jgi:hypothetical protein
LVKLRELLPGRRRRKARRPDAPKTIIPPRDETPAERLLAAQRRLQEQIPPRSDDGN